MTSSYVQTPRMWFTRSSRFNIYLAIGACLIFSCVPTAELGQKKRDASTQKDGDVQKDAVSRDSDSNADADASKVYTAADCDAVIAGQGTGRCTGSFVCNASYGRCSRSYQCRPDGVFSAMGTCGGVNCDGATDETACTAALCKWNGTQCQAPCDDYPNGSWCAGDLACVWSDAESKCKPLVRVPCEVEGGSCQPGYICAHVCDCCGIPDAGPPASHDVCIPDTGQCGTNFQVEGRGCVCTFEGEAECLCA